MSEKKGSGVVSFRIKNSERDELLKLISSKVGNLPLIVHEKKESETEITITVIVASFTPSQVKELENIRDTIDVKTRSQSNHEANVISFLDKERPTKNTKTELKA